MRLHESVVSSATVVPLSSFADWLQDTDDHAAHHLSVIDRVSECLDSGMADPEAACELSAKLERWRYQLLSEHAGRLAPRDAELAVALNATSNVLADRAEFDTRATHHAIHQSGDEAIAPEAIDAIDPEYPLEPLISRARQTTAANFAGDARTSVGDLPRWSMLLYAPLYVSSRCVNHCTYCGFRFTEDIERHHLTLEEVEQQVEHLEQHGFGHLLVVGGEYPQLTTVDYYSDIARCLVRHNVAAAIEIAPQTTASYARLATAGVMGLTLYQETYDEQLYTKYHPRGPKANYHWRLESHDRAAEAGIRRLGLGVLMGLADPEQELMALMRHGAYLARRFPHHTLAFSLPRIHEAPDGFAPSYRVSDDDLVRYYSALRLAFPTAVLVLSTRESAELRNRLAGICITQMSAGSSTIPGGYSEEQPTRGEQFPVTDHRSPREVADWLAENGFQVDWKPGEED